MLCLMELTQSVISMVYISVSLTLNFQYTIGLLEGSNLNLINSMPVFEAAMTFCSLEADKRGGNI